MPPVRQQAPCGDSRPNAIPAFALYGEPLQTPDVHLIHVETIAARSELYDWTIRPHRHRDLNQLLVVHQGRVAITLDDMQTELEAPALIAVPPSSVHSFTFMRGTSGLVVSFARGLISELAAEASGLGEFLERPAVQALASATVADTDLQALGELLLREFTRRASERHTALRGLLGAFLANAVRLANRAIETSPTSAAAERDLVSRFRRAIEANYRTHMAIGKYAAALGMSAATLRRACLEVTGQSPIELVHLRLLLEAERQLRYTTVPIAQIAYELGFEDPAYFSRFFARWTHLSPRAFRGLMP